MTYPLQEVVFVAYPPGVTADFFYGWYYTSAGNTTPYVPVASGVCVHVKHQRIFESRMRDIAKLAILING